MNTHAHLRPAGTCRELPRRPGRRGLSRPSAVGLAAGQPLPPRGVGLGLLGARAEGALLRLRLLLEELGGGEGGGLGLGLEGCGRGPLRRLLSVKGSGRRVGREKEEEVSEKKREAKSRRREGREAPIAARGASSPATAAPTSASGTHVELEGLGRHKVTLAANGGSSDPNATALLRSPKMLRPCPCPCPCRGRGSGRQDDGGGVHLRQLRRLHLLHWVGLRLRLLLGLGHGVEGGRGRGELLGHGLLLVASLGHVRGRGERQLPSALGGGGGGGGGSLPHGRPMAMALRARC